MDYSNVDLVADLDLADDTKPLELIHKFELEEFCERYNTSDKYNYLKCLLRDLGIYVDRGGPWLAGGSIRDILLNKKTDTDYDFFFNNQGQLDKFIENMKKIDNVEIRENKNNITMTFDYKPTDDKDGELVKIKVQLITFKFYESVYNLIDSFDFTITQFAWDGEHCYAGPYSMRDLSHNRLTVNKITYAEASMRRIYKYMKKGFYACDGFFGHFLNQVIENPNTVNNNIEYMD